jgi:tetraacyldisaccharide 4'-kinase
MRLMKFKTEMQNLPLYVIPIQHQFLFDEGKRFDELVLKFAKS